MRFGATLFFIVIFAKICSAFSIKGTVYGSNSEKLSYANIYVKGTTNGTSANVEGQYQLDLPAGTYEIVYQHLGYKQHIESVNLVKDLDITITLEELQYQIRDVVVNGNEDPALAVIRKAIEKRKYFLNVVESYSCDAYVKGMQRILQAPDKILGRKINRTGILTGPNNSGILYLSESQSKLYYKKPNKFHEVIYSSKVSGKSNGFTFNSAQDFFFNFYDRSITIPFIAPRPFISPLSENTFFYYNFKMIGAYKEGDKLINKILVTPKRKSDPCFSGVLSIVEDNWNIHSLELYLTKANGIQYVDTLKVTQYFVPVKNDIWLPTQQRYDVQASFLGIKGDGYYLGVFKNYVVNGFFGLPTPVVKMDSTKRTAKSEKKLEKLQKKEEKKIEKKIFTAEIVKIEKEANKRDTMYWDSIRPIPLTAMELQDYNIKDSIQVIRDSKVFKDSTDKKLNMPGPLTIILGYTYRKQYKKISVDFPSLLNLVNFNTVEGVNLQGKFAIRKTFSDDRRISFEPTIRYGTLNKQFNLMGSFAFLNSQIHDEFFVLSGGRYISQINEYQPQTEFGNTFQSLVLRNNFMKIYEKYFVKLMYSRELFNGVRGTLVADYERRSPLSNFTDFSFFHKGNTNYPTPNAMDLPNVTDEQITAHNSFRIDLRVHVTFGNQYITRPDMRIRTGSKYPELQFIYKRSISIKGFSDQDFDYLEAQLQGYLPEGLFGTTHYRFGGGGFASHKAVDYPDYKHFYGNFLNTGGTDMLGFYLLQYYRNSTDLYFAEAHIEHHFGGFLFNKIPGVRTLKWGEVLGFHFLYTPTRKEYFQLDAGIDNIFKIIRVDFVAGFLGETVYHFGARVGIVLDFRR
ncbi:MAG: hypothetical protein JWO06_3143 [Bacteroidota bacterium]|nr:hypothetical protein [Bacteroidota bacterium]